LPIISNKQFFYEKERAIKELVGPKSSKVRAVSKIVGLKTAKRRTTNKATGPNSATVRPKSIPQFIPKIS